MAAVGLSAWRKDTCRRTSNAMVWSDAILDPGCRPACMLQANPSRSAHEIFLTPSLGRDSIDPGRHSFTERGV
jgi:hypothetical protein